MEDEQKKGDRERGEGNNKSIEDVSAGYRVRSSVYMQSTWGWAVG
jgi:hypothetical protein